MGRQRAKPKPKTQPPADVSPFDVGEDEDDVTGGGIPGIAGSYSLPVGARYCFSSAGSFLPGNYFAGVRGSYGASFTIGDNILGLGVERDLYDQCGCDGRPVALSVSYRPAGRFSFPYAQTNSPRPDDDRLCVPMCSNAETELTYSNLVLQQFNDGPSSFPSIGTVTVRIPAS